MVSDMLFLARADRGMFVLHVEPIDLREEANKVAEFFEIAAAESGMTIEVTGEGQTDCDRSMARRALTNLLSNAVRYSPAGSRIKVELHRTEGGRCIVDVTNPARNMGEEELRRLFGRFSRGEASSRPLGDEGTGLGLSIVASIMRLHGGEALAESVTDGLRFRLVFQSDTSGGANASAGRPLDAVVGRLANGG
jgi:two-component system heavy metal sensor histidine kinase CusS